MLGIKVSLVEGGGRRVRRVLVRVRSVERRWVVRRLNFSSVVVE